MEVMHPDQKAKDKAEDYAYPAHDILLGNDILILENLCNLDKIKWVRGLYSFLPLKLKDTDGSPIRAVFIDPYKIIKPTDIYNLFVHRV